MSPLPPPESAERVSDARLAEILADYKTQHFSSILDIHKALTELAELRSHRSQGGGVGIKASIQAEAALEFYADPVTYEEILLSEWFRDNPGKDASTGYRCGRVDVTARSGFAIAPIWKDYPGKRAKEALAAIRSALAPPDGEVTEAAYTPALIHYDGEGDGYWEFLQADTATVTGQVVAANVEPIWDMADDSNLLGFRIYDIAEVLDRAALTRTGK